MSLCKEEFKFKIMNQLKQDDAPIHSLLLCSTVNRIDLENPYQKEKLILFKDFSVLAKFMTEYNNFLNCNVSFEDCDEVSIRKPSNTATLTENDMWEYFVEKIEFSGRYIIFSIDAMCVTIEKDYEITKTLKNQYQTFYNVEVMEYSTRDDVKTRNMKSYAKLRSSYLFNYVDLEISERVTREFASFCVMNHLYGSELDKLKSAIYQARVGCEDSPMTLIMKYLQDN